MSSKQTRRSISVRGTTYFTLRQYCEDHDRSMSDLVEELLAKTFEAAGQTTAVVPLDAPLRSIKAAKPVAAPRALAAKVLRAPAPAKDAHVAAPVKAAPQPTAAKVAPVPAKVAPAPAKVAPVKAAPVKVASAAVDGQNGSGRPAPTPAKSVVADRVVAPKGDYRVISF